MIKTIYKNTNGNLPLVFLLGYFIIQASFKVAIKENPMKLPAPTSSVKDLANLAVESIDFIINEFKKDWQTLATKYNFALNDYYESKLISVSKVKPIFSPESVDLKDIYVPQNFSFSGNIYDFFQIHNFIKNNKKVILLGTAGAGKSCFLKYYFYESLRQKSFFPLFYELRKVDETQSSLMDSLHMDIARFNEKFTKENLDFILKRKNTLLLLDGFDEISFEKKQDYFKQIMDIAEKYPELNILLSSRVEQGRFQEWNLFNVINLESLTLEQACKVVKKLNYDSEVKERFLSALQKNLYNKHRDFASNPLLLTIMLFTYEQNGEIPEKMHIFYEQAYQTLFNKHDSYKQGFVRKSLTNLDMQQFKVVFSLFCLTTYHKQLFEFSESDFNERLEKCLGQIPNQQVSAENLKKELLSNVPLMVQDGLHFCFAHRSFQEYFSACYLIHNQNLSSEIYDTIGKRLESDNVLSMTFDMNQRLLEEKWILPKIQKILSEIKNDSSVDGRFKNMLSFYEGFHIIEISKNNLQTILIKSESSNIDFLHFLSSKYNIDTQNEINEILSINTNANTIHAEYGNFIDFNKLNKAQQRWLIQLNVDALAIYFINILRELEQQIKNSLSDSQNDLDELLFR